MAKGKVGGIILAIIILLALILVGLSWKQIPAGYVGVVYNINGGIEDELLSQGRNFVAPTKKVTLYSIALEQSYLTSEDKGDSPNDESFNVPTSDGKTVRVNLEFSYRFIEDRLPETFVMFKGKSGEAVKDTFIKPKVIAWTQEVTANYPVADLFGDMRTVINEELDRHLQERFLQYGIEIDTVNFTNIVVDAETEQAIQKKVDAQQELELAVTQAEIARVNAEKEKNIALIEAEKDKETAAIEAERKEIAAQGEANAILIAAQAEAEANRLISESLTPELIEMMQIEAWDGSVPLVQGDATPIISID